MSEPHPLDRPVWNALSGPQAGLAQGDDRARRYPADMAMFAAASRRSPSGMTALGELIAQTGLCATVEAEVWPPINGTRVISRAVIVQMMATSLNPPERAEEELADYEIVPLGDADAAEMVALATLTQPGPFFARTHRLGGFVGIKHGGRLSAMAGERMKLAGFTEVSGVCTHPDHRGKGYGEALSRVVTQRILDRGETAFLHAYGHNEGAITLYRRLGFTHRARMQMNILSRADGKA